LDGDASTSFGQSPDHFTSRHTGGRDQNQLRLKGLHGDWARTSPAVRTWAATFGLSGAGTLKHGFNHNGDILLYGRWVAFHSDCSIMKTIALLVDREMASRSA
jgi:hypothetical protein